MEFLGVGALSSSQLLVVFAFALFATIVFSSIYIRIKGQYRGRNKLPDHTQRKGLGLRRTRDSDLPSIPKENHEVVSGARKKAPAKDEDEGFQFDFDLPLKPTGPIEHVASRANGADNTWEHAETPTEIPDGAAAEANGVGSDEQEYEEIMQDEDDSVSPVEYEHFDESSIDGVDANSEHVLGDQESTDTWDANYDDEYGWNDSDEAAIDVGSPGNIEDVPIEENELQVGEYEVVEDEIPQTLGDDEQLSSEYPLNLEQANSTYDAQEMDQPFEPDVDESVVPFDHRTVEAKRTGPSNNGDALIFSVVSVCLISDEEGQIFRDIRGEHLAAFLNKRGFIYLDEEYHLQHKSMVEKGAIRVRNYEDSSIGTLVKQNLETRGFRLYFRPSDCADPLATLNEMLKIANLAIGFFKEVSSKPLVIYDGRKDSSGHISPLTQGDYNELKRDLSVAFPRNLDDTSKRTVITRNEYAPSEDLPTRAELY